MRELSALYIYPIKSLAGISLFQAQVTARGLQHDRRWMLVDVEGRFLSQRELPQMALFQPSIRGSALMIHHRSSPGDSLTLPLSPPKAAPRRLVTVWGDECQAVVVSEAANLWFSQRLGVPCQLVYMPEGTHRPVDPAYAPKGSNVSFADGFPFLLIGQASLNQLNQQLAEPIGMGRFRPNLVVTGTQAHEEDAWKTFRIGKVTFRAVKPCERCAIITVNPQTAEKGKEPTATLSRYRREGNKILFGQNLIAENPGVLSVGDGVLIP